MRRRQFLLSASAGASLVECTSGGRTVFSSSAAAVLSTTVKSAGETGSLSAIIEYNGGIYRYDETSGTNLGAYIDPQHRFVQNSVVTANERLPLTVSFRRDLNDQRTEIIFELGRLWSSAAPANMTSYLVTIVRGDREVFRTNVPQHYWFARWRWQSAPRPVTATVGSLIKSGLLPHYDAGATYGSNSGVKAQSYQIMQLAGIAHYMPETGERDDIGPVTEAQAQFICTGSDVALQTLLAQAEAAGTIPWHFRDERTGAPLDVVRYDNAALSPAGKPFVAGTKTPITVDTAHQPAIAYVPFLLTGDPYHLETMQFQATYNIITWAPGLRYRTHQVRGHAWSLRTLGQVARITPDATPQWMLGRSHYDKLLAKQRDWMNQTFVAASDPPRAVFRTIDESFGDRGEGDLQAHTYIAPWEEDFEAFVLCWLVHMGYNDWEAIARWKVGSTIARTNGKSGWPRSHPTPYYLILRHDPNSPWANSWEEAAALNAASYAQDGPEADHLFAGGALAYPSYTRGVLAIAARLDFPQAKSCHEWIDNELKRYAARKALSYKWAIT